MKSRLLTLTCCQIICLLHLGASIGSAAEVSRYGIGFSSIETVVHLDSDGSFKKSETKCVLNVRDSRLLSSLGYGELPVKQTEYVTVDFTAIKVTEQDGKIAVVQPKIMERDANTNFKIYEPCVLKVLRLPPLKSGDTVEFKITSTARRHFDLMAFYSTQPKDLFAQAMPNIPVSLWKLSVRGACVCSTVYSTDDSIREIDEQCWQAKDLTFSETDYTGVVLSAADESEFIEELRKKYEVFSDDFCFSAPILEQLREGLSDEEKVEAVIRHIHDQIRYCSSTLAPKSVNDVFDTGTADCDEVVQVAVAILKAAGLEAGIALTNVDLPEYERYSPLGFDHAVLFVKLQGRFKFYELTEPFGSNVVHLQGKLALLLDKHEHHFKRITDGGTVIVQEFSFQESGVFAGSCKITGRLADHFRAQLSHGQSEKECLATLLNLLPEDIIASQVDGLDGYNSLSLSTTTRRPFAVHSGLNFDEFVTATITVLDSPIKMTEGSSFVPGIGMVHRLAEGAKQTFHFTFQGRVKYSSDRDPDFAKMRSAFVEVLRPISEYRSGIEVVALKPDGAGEAN